MYSIGQVSEMFNIPASTLRYYDKEGLFPAMERSSGIRQFTDNELDALRVINCLKKSGLEIKDIKQFMQWCEEGPSTFKKRLNLFKKQEEKLLSEMAVLNRALAMIQYKKWYYQQAIDHEGVEYARAMLPDNLPEHIQQLYNISHMEMIQ